MEADEEGELFVHQAQLDKLQFTFYSQTFYPEERVYLLNPGKHLLQLVLSAQRSQFSAQLDQTLNFKIPYHENLLETTYLNLTFTLLDDYLLLI